MALTFLSRPHQALPALHSSDNPALALAPVIVQRLQPPLQPRGNRPCVRTGVSMVERVVLRGIPDSCRL